MKRIKILISVLLILILLIQLTIFCVFAESKNRGIGSNVLGVIKTDDNSSYNLSSVKINVYKLEMDKEDKTGETYNHVFFTSVYPNKEGDISFARPSKYCYIEVDLRSLSDDFGALVSGAIINPSDTSFELKLSKINNFEVNILSGKVKFYNEREENLSVKNCYKISFNENYKKALLYKNSIQCVCKIGKNILNKNIDLHSLSRQERMDDLYNKKLISNTEIIDYYLDKAESTDDYEKTNSLINHLYSLVEDDGFSRTQQKRLEQLRYLSHITYNNENTYTKYSFTLHYESGQIPNSTLKNVLNALNYAHNKICNELSFDEPFLEYGETTYHVYITENINSIAYTCPCRYNSSSNNIASYIVLNSNYLTSLLEIRSIICHEYTHAVQYSYMDWFSFTQDCEMASFNEATANAMALHLVPSITSFNSSNINLLTYPNVPIFYDSLYDENSSNQIYYGRRYSLVLFPLFIKQEFSLETIRNIYEEYDGLNNFFTAMENVLYDNNTSIKNTYLDFMVANYDLENNYDCYQTGWQKKPTIIDPPYYTSLEANVVHELPDLSTTYYELNSTNNTYNANTFTFHLSEDTDLSNAFLYKIYTNPSGAVYTQKIPFTTRGRTVTSGLYNNAKVCVFISNTSYGNTYSSFHNPSFEYTVDVR